MTSVVTEKKTNTRILSAEDKILNKEFENDIAFLKDFDKKSVLAGQSLLRIREQKSYRIQYKTFEQAIYETLGWERSYGYRLMALATTVDELSLLPTGDKIVNELDLKERHVRALSECAGDAESRLQVLTALRNDGVKVTDKSIRQKADEILPAKTVQQSPKPAPIMVDPQQESDSPEDRQSSFDPTTFDPSMQSESKPAGVIDCRGPCDAILKETSGQLSSLFARLDVLARKFDLCNAATPLHNFKHLNATRQRLWTEVEAAKGTMKALEKAWVESAGKAAH